jgi:valyl-tRNA synthetase
VFPMSLRPQAHDIIRTWLFSTVLRSYLEHGSLPWAHAAISGFVLDPDRKKMSKSKGNVVTPMGLLEEHGSDAVRYWAASGGPGVDTAFDTGQMKVGRRLAIKLLNASKFILASPEPTGEVASPLDRGMLTGLAALVTEVTDALDAYEYGKALQRAESFFWDFCDNYLELVKQRAYGAAGEQGAASARRTLELALSTLLRLFAPHLPFVTEEVWSWWQPGSIHRASWPDPGLLRDEVGGAHVDPLVYTVSAEVLGEIRKAKTTQQKSMRAEVERAVVRDTAERLRALEAAAEDVQQAGRVHKIDVLEGEAFTVDVELAEDAA